MIGWHLVAPPRGVGQQFARIGAGSIQLQSARAGQRRITVLSQLLTCPVNEFIDIAVIVGEQDETLEILDPGAGIVCQSGQAEIGAQAIEQGQRDSLIGIGQFDPVSELVADQRQFCGREMLGQVRRAERAEAGGGVDHIGERDFLSRRANFNLNRIVISQQAQLLAKVVGKQRRTGHGGGESATAAEPPEGSFKIGTCFNPGIMDP